MILLLAASGAFAASAEFPALSSSSPLAPHAHSTNCPGYAGGTWLPQYKPELHGDPAPCLPTHPVTSACLGFLHPPHSHAPSEAWLESRLCQKVLSELLWHSESKPPALLCGGPMVASMRVRVHV